MLESKTKLLTSKLIDPSPKWHQPREDWKLGYSSFTSRVAAIDFRHFLLIEKRHNCRISLCIATSKKNRNLRKDSLIKDHCIIKFDHDAGDYFAVSCRVYLQRTIITISSGSLKNDKRASLPHSTAL